MVNVVIYIDDSLDPKLIISSLFEKKLIAKATIDFNNKVFLISEGKLKENNNSVITCQTRSLLFTDIVKFVEENFGKKIIFENMTAGFLLRCQNILRYFTPEMMHFQARKKMILTNVNVIAFDPIKI